MRKTFLAIALLFSIFKSYADEGMWLPIFLGQQVYDDMVKRGLKLTKEQLYSINKASIKDAIVIFNGGCTGEIVSSDGLVFTNHHCGYEAIAAASTVQNNYLHDGFFAKSRGMEIPSKVYVQFLLRIDDVTKQIDSALNGLNATDRAKKQSEILAEINKKNSDATQNIEGRVSVLFKGNQFLLFVYQKYTDLRLVAAPPESIGKFGGDTDNWEWPRHTGDFSVFRVYMTKDGKPGDYAADNVPLKPKYFLPVSIKGFKDGDYSMIYGYPGSTNRYETSYGIKLATEINNPSLVDLRDIRLKLMFEEMKKDPAVRLQLAPSYASIANYWKFYDGETKQLLKYHIFEQKQALENTYKTWAKGKPEFENVFNDWPKVYDAWRPYAKQRVYLIEGVLGSPLAKFASTLVKLESDMVKSGVDAGAVKQDIEAAKTARKSFLDAENRASDQKIMAATCMRYYLDVDKNQHPIGFYESLKSSFGDLKEEGTYKNWANSVFSNTMILNDAKWDAFTKNPDPIVLQADPAFAYAGVFVKNYTNKYDPFYQQFLAKNNDLARLYLKGIMQMDPKKKMYPDATFTMRVSYGNVKSYVPKDAVKYDYVTTMSGVLEKYKPGDYEFDLPAKLIDLAQKKDYGQYIDKIHNDLVVCFITTNDITGGNSGSPVMDANGNLIGLAFDGNYEALSHKLAFDKDLNRTICVDIRYVLWCIDKLGGASNIINELKLVK
ncbi:MAG: serine protease [Bacteroidetes bacterium]|nr:MAG: serine protease [Bacteroidota bacterium]